MFVDVHCHLSFSQYDQDRDLVLDRLTQAGVGLLIHPGTNLQTSRDAIDFAQKHQMAHANVGFHPGDVDQVSASDFEALQALATEEKVVGIGEIGLDYHYPDINKANQEMVFRESLRLAKKLDLPVVIHSRDAWPDTFRILDQESHSGLRGMMHCFSGGVEEARRSVKMGFKLSIPGVVTFKKSQLPDVVNNTNLNDLLTETDCPYLAPVPYRGKRNEPAYVVEVAKKIADIKKVPLEVVEERVYNTATWLFNI
jgi:TatD DNase family protein